ncbi:MAG: transcriptional regulator [Bacteroides sp.]|nr:transcriptional regulator [Bacteroides sp.]
MACSIDFIEHICSSLASLGDVRYRKMMGDYVIYLNEKCIITACDNIAYIKKLPCLREMMHDAETGCPYEGAREAYILDTLDQKLLRNLIPILWDNLPFPKTRKKIIK